MSPAEEKLIRYIAYAVWRKNRHLDVEELVSVGWMRLPSIRRKLPTKPEDVTWQQFYAIRLRSQMWRWVRRHMELPERVTQFLNRVERAEDRLAQQLLRQPTQLEAAEHLGMTWDEYQQVRVRRMFFEPVFLDDEVWENQHAGDEAETEEIAEQLAVDPADDPTELLPLLRKLQLFPEVHRRAYIEYEYWGATRDHVARRWKHGSTWVDATRARVQKVLDSDRTFKCCAACGAATRQYADAGKQQCKRCWSWERRHGFRRPDAQLMPPSPFCVGGCGQELYREGDASGGRCKTCAAYLRRFGRERVSVDREAVVPPCTNCRKNDKGRRITGLCTSCYHREKAGMDISKPSRQGRPRPPACLTCGAKAETLNRRLTAGRCHTCYEYERRTGKERPAGAVGHSSRATSSATPPPGVGVIGQAAHIAAAQHRPEAVLRIHRPGGDPRHGVVQDSRVSTAEVGGCRRLQAIPHQPPALDLSSDRAAAEARCGWRRSVRGRRRGLFVSRELLVGDGVVEDGDYNQRQQAEQKPGAVVGSGSHQPALRRFWPYPWVDFSAAFRVLSGRS